MGTMKVLIAKLIVAERQMSSIPAIVKTGQEQDKKQYTFVSCSENESIVMILWLACFDCHIKKIIHLIL